jgi:hypothetical protein
MLESVPDASEASDDGPTVPEEPRLAEEPEELEELVETDAVVEAAVPELVDVDSLFAVEPVFPEEGSHELLAVAQARGLHSARSVHAHRARSRLIPRSFDVRLISSSRKRRTTPLETKRRRSRAPRSSGRATWRRALTRGPSCSIFTLSFIGRRPSPPRANTDGPGR